MAVADFADDPHGTGAVSLVHRFGVDSIDAEGVRTMRPDDGSYFRDATQGLVDVAERGGCRVGSRPSRVGPATSAAGVSGGLRGYRSAHAHGAMNAQVGAEDKC